MPWVKKFADGSVIKENQEMGITWLRTPLKNIVEVWMKCGSVSSPSLHGHEFWHSRRGISNLNTGAHRDIAERIQVKTSDGWQTIEWNGRVFKTYLADQAYGKPVKK